MQKILIIGLVVLFFSSGAMVYNNGNISLNVENAKKTLIETFERIVKFAEENS